MEDTLSSTENCVSSTASGNGVREIKVEEIIASSGDATPSVESISVHTNGRLVDTSVLTEEEDTEVCFDLVNNVKVNGLMSEEEEETSDTENGVGEVTAEEADTSSGDTTASAQNMFFYYFLLFALNICKKETSEVETENLEPKNS